MNDIVSESPTSESRQWIGRFLIAVVLGEAIWAFLVAITTHLAIPAMARLMGVADEQSPLYLGRGDYNVPALLAAALQLCLAGIVAVLLSSWSQRSVRVRTRVVSRVAAPSTDAVPSIVAPPAVPIAAQAQVPAIPVASRIAETPAVAANTQIASANIEPVLASAPPAVASTQPAATPPSAAPPAKPKKAKPVYYNIVGEPIEDDE